jgi:hypothetical protein
VVCSGPEGGRRLATRGVEVIAARQRLDETGEEGGSAFGRATMLREQFTGLRSAHSAHEGRQSVERTMQSLEKTWSLDGSLQDSR